MSAWLGLLARAGLFLLLVGTFSCRVVRVGEAPVAPLRPADWVGVNMNSHVGTEPQRGDMLVVVEGAVGRRLVVGRVIGLPGERVTLSAEGVVTVDGARLPAVVEVPLVEGPLSVSLRDTEYALLAGRDGDRRLIAALRPSLAGVAGLVVWPPSRWQALAPAPEWERWPGAGPARAQPHPPRTLATEAGGWWRVLVRVGLLLVLANVLLRWPRPRPAAMERPDVVLAVRLAVAVTLAAVIFEALFHRPGIGPAFWGVVPRGDGDPLGLSLLGALLHAGTWSAATAALFVLYGRLLAVPRRMGWSAIPPILLAAHAAWGMWSCALRGLGMAPPSAIGHAGFVREAARLFGAAAGEFPGGVVAALTWPTATAVGLVQRGLGDVALSTMVVGALLHAAFDLAGHRNAERLAAASAAIRQARLACANDMRRLASALGEINARHRHDPMRAFLLDLALLAAVVLTWLGAGTWGVYSLPAPLLAGGDIATRPESLVLPLVAGLAVALRVAQRLALTVPLPGVVVIFGLLLGGIVFLICVFSAAALSCVVTGVAAAGLLRGLHAARARDPLLRFPSVAQLSSLLVLLLVLPRPTGSVAWRAAGDAGGVPVAAAAPTPPQEDGETLGARIRGRLALGDWRGALRELEADGAAEEAASEIRALRLATLLAAARLIVDAGEERALAAACLEVARGVDRAAAEPREALAGLLISVLREELAAAWLRTGPSLQCSGIREAAAGEELLLRPDPEPWHPTQPLPGTADEELHVLVADDGSWFRVELGDERAGWLHRSCAATFVRDDGRRAVRVSGRRPRAELDPLARRAERLAPDRRIEIWWLFHGRLVLPGGVLLAVLVTLVYWIVGRTAR